MRCVCEDVQEVRRSSDTWIHTRETDTPCPFSESQQTEGPNEDLNLNQNQNQNQDFNEQGTPSDSVQGATFTSKGP